MKKKKRHLKYVRASRGNDESATCTDQTFPGAEQSKEMLAVNSGHNCVFVKCQPPCNGNTFKVVSPNATLYEARVQPSFLLFRFYYQKEYVQIRNIQQITTKRSSENNFMLVEPIYLFSIK